MANPGMSDDRTAIDQELTRVRDGAVTRPTEPHVGSTGLESDSTGQPPTRETTEQALRRDAEDPDTGLPPADGDDD
jgi:hypothetical protein